MERQWCYVAGLEPLKRAQEWYMQNHCSRDLATKDSSSCGVKPACAYSKMQVLGIIETVQALWNSEDPE